MEFLYDLFAGVPIWLIWPIVVGVAVYWYLTRNYDYFKKRGIPYVSPLPGIGTMMYAFSGGFHDVEVARYKEKGRIHGTFEGRKPALTVAEPELLRDIFVKDFQFFSQRRDIVTGNPIADKMVSSVDGEDWKRIRTIITPAFTTGKIRKMTSIFTDSSKTLAGNLEKAAQSGESIECKRYFGAFTMDVIASAAFGTKIDSHNDPQNEFVANARSVFSQRFQWRFIILLVLPKLMRLLRISIFPPGVLEFFKDVTLQIIKQRRDKNITRNDVLQLLLDCVKEEQNEKKGTEQRKEEEEEEDSALAIGHEEGNREIFKPAYITKTLSEDELVAQCVIFFLAGYETTASILSVTAYEMALNPRIQEKLISEIDESVGPKNELTYDAIRGMKYLDRVVSESLRKYPPAIRGERRCSIDYHLKTTDITVPKGMIIGIPIYAIHHDPEHYPNPEVYDPERFSAEQKESRHAYAYLPFGAGPRNCLGMRFALMEIKVCLANILRQFRFKPCPETQVPLQFYTGQGVLQTKSVKLKVEKRSDVVNK